ncbi:translin-associated protein X [Episyrphus balteatus]|uniref:translin-associated protein X n=1 Tax=Episyrphus balteatus TaxID=286459 RepID=UPI0024852CB8|nr:translin-associated protein X [Episyrphus balteatus]
MSFKPNHNRSRNKNSKPHNKDAVPVDESNPVIIAFKQYALELDDKHDRYERIVKLSRDTTIESKRIIFLLHTIDPNKNNKEKILLEAKTRLDNLISNKFFEVAKELENRDPYQYMRAYCAGLQEFIEAYTYYEYLNESELSDWIVLQGRMKFTFTLEPKESDESIEPKEVDECIEKVEKTVECLVDPTEYILGLGDLTGELMRRCINSLGSGDTNTCQDSCKVLQNFYKGFLGLHSVRNREFGRKLYTLHQSVIKAEHVCYNVKVRGGEAARRGTMADDKPADDFDEGFF